MTFRFSRRGVLGVLGAAALPGLGMAQSAAGGSDSAFAALSARWLETMTRLSPVSATQLGDHRFDAELDDISAAGRAAQTSAAKALLTDLTAINRAALSRPNQIDAVILENELRQELWTAETLQDWAWDPLLYTGLAGEALYGLLARDFAPLPARLSSAISRMEKLPVFLDQARASLDPRRVPLIHAQTAAKQHPGLMGEVAELIAPQASALSVTERARLEKATTALKTAADAYQAWLDGTLIPNAKGDFRLGARLYDAKLAFVLQSSLSRQEIRARAEAAVTETRATMYTLAAGVMAGKAGASAAPVAPTPAEQQAVIKAALDIAAADHPARDAVVETAKAGLAAATAFVRVKDLITLPAAPVEVILMPEFARGVAVAYCDAPGPLDRRLATFYAVSPIPDDWTAARTESFLREYNRRGIYDIATHEAMPGHYVQLDHATAFSSTLRAVLGSGPFIEGWAVYAESMMAQEGFLDGDPLYKLVVLKTKLRSITNAILDQAIHVDGMSKEAAMALMMETAFQEEEEAAGKWVRASVSSAQLPYYFVGSEEHWAARREAERRWGQGFTLKRYHDGILAFGSPPVRLARAELFDEPIA